MGDTLRKLYYSRYIKPGDPRIKEYIEENIEPISLLRNIDKRKLLKIIQRKLFLKFCFGMLKNLGRSVIQLDPEITIRRGIRKLFSISYFIMFNT